MKPMRKGRARNELQSTIYEILYELQPPTRMTDGSKDTARLSAMLGGAIQQTCKDMGITEDLFFKYLNHHLWDLTRTLRASNLLDKVE